jgi:hypothetical protein
MRRFTLQEVCGAAFNDGSSRDGSWGHCRIAAQASESGLHVHHHSALRRASPSHFPLLWRLLPPLLVVRARPCYSHGRRIARVAPSLAAGALLAAVPAAALRRRARRRGLCRVRGARRISLGALPLCASAALAGLGALGAARRRDGAVCRGCCASRRRCASGPADAAALGALESGTDCVARAVAAAALAMTRRQVHSAAVNFCAPVIFSNPLPASLQ